jgi:hypothetical protein
MLEAQEDETLLPLCEAGDPGLVGMQSQPQRFQDRLDPGLGLYDPGPRRGEHDEVVTVSDQRSQPVTLSAPRLIEHVQHDVGHERGNG